MLSAKISHQSRVKARKRTVFISKRRRNDASRPASLEILTGAEKFKKILIVGCRTAAGRGHQGPHFPGEIDDIDRRSGDEGSDPPNEPKDQTRAWTPSLASSWGTKATEQDIAAAELTSAILNRSNQDQENNPR